MANTPLSLEKLKKLSVVQLRNLIYKFHKKRNLGIHYLIELYDCDPKILDNMEEVDWILNEAAKTAKANIVTDFFHKFHPKGVSGAIVIQESHFTIHSWPEYKYAAIDLFTCGEEANPKNVPNFVKMKFKSSTMDVKIEPRGDIIKAIKKLKKNELIELLIYIQENASKKKG